jgi:LPXTG-site transpeptidase (sortase) family protein
MKELVRLTARLIRAGERAYERKWQFLGFFAIAFLGSALLLGALGLLPDASGADSAAAVASAPVVTPAGTASAIASPELPTKIEIPAISLSATISNPITTDLTVLDEELLKGAVRYSTSAELNQNGNVVLFGHSSYLPIVGNQAYKTFNGIQKLKPGATITVYSSAQAYTYAVKSVTKESANDAVIPLSVSGRILTLSTCDSFTVKTDRFVVVADFVESHPLPL